MPATSALLVREGQTDLAPFSPPDLSLAHAQWLLELSARIDRLNLARDHSIDLDYGGTCLDSDLVAPLEEAVDEARRMVCALGGEMRRRSEGSLPVWCGVKSMGNACRGEGVAGEAGGDQGAMTRVASART
ncbi:hypothetical protein IAU60_004541 [Kwoniella sp. DSM 27419]